MQSAQNRNAAKIKYYRSIMRGVDLRLQAAMNAIGRAQLEAQSAARTANEAWQEVQRVLEELEKP